MKVSEHFWRNRGSFSFRSRGGSVSFNFFIPLLIKKRKKRGMYVNFDVQMRMKHTEFEWRLEMITEAMGGEGQFRYRIWRRKSVKRRDCCTQYCHCLTLIRRWFERYCNVKGGRRVSVPDLNLFKRFSCLPNEAKNFIPSNLGRGQNKITRSKIIWWERRKK